MLSRQQLVAWLAQAAGDRRYKTAAVVLGIAVAAAQWGRVLAEPQGDFHLHWEIGRRFVANTYLYADDLDYPYPPFWAMAHAPLTVVSVHTAQILIYPLAIASVLALLWALHRLTNRQLPLKPDALFWTGTLAVVFASRFLVRDLLECGINTALVAMAYLAVLLWQKRREWLGGAVLGLAIALKCTPALFVIWFAWKRQWKMVLTTATATAAFTLLPIVGMGPSNYAQTFTAWATRVVGGVGQPNPAVGVLGEETIMNVSLRPALARYLMVVRQWHGNDLFEHPWSVFLLDLPPAAANTIALGLMGALLALVAWQTRHALIRRDAPTVAWECALVSLLILLYSPVTWGQHCVGVLPVCCLLTRTRLSSGPLPGWIRGTFAVYLLLVLGLNREVVGREMTLLLDSYRVTTWCLLGLTAIGLACRSHSTHKITGVIVAADALEGQPRRAERVAA